MPVSCQKNFSITVNSASLLYWSFDNVSGGNFIDNSVGASLVDVGVPTVSGFISNGVKFINTSSSLTSDLTTPPKPARYAQLGVSHCFWARMEVKAGTFPTELVATVLDGDDAHQYEFSFRPGLGGTIDNATLDLIKDPSLLGPTVLTVVVPIVWVVGQWNFFAFIYNQTTGKLNVSVNNGTPSTSAGSFTLPTGSWNNIHPNTAPLNTFPTISMDEYLIHTGAALNSNQIAALFNCGNGMTWPAAGSVATNPSVSAPSCIECVAPACIQADSTFVNAVNLNQSTNSGDPPNAWNGKLVSPTFQFVYPVSGLIVGITCVGGAGNVWTLNLGPGAWVSTGPANTASPLVTYEARTNAFPPVPGVPNFATLTSC